MNNSYNKSLLNEVSKLDSDLREIYEEFGTNNIYLRKFVTSSEQDIYGYTEEEYYSEPYKLLGRVQLNNNEENQTTIGGSVGNGDYTFYVITSILKEYGIDTITTDDRIVYLGNELSISLVTPVNILGDFALQYKIIAHGIEAVPPHYE